KKIMETRGYSRVQVDQSRIKARIIIEVKGDETETKPLLEDIFFRLTNG
ncbi:MAG: hypothetical protein UT57_C0005G0017, partial [Microgenomates group bacterium GW2011_GWC1_39_7]